MGCFYGVYNMPLKDAFGRPVKDFSLRTRMAESRCAHKRPGSPSMDQVQATKDGLTHHIYNRMMQKLNFEKVTFFDVENDFSGDSDSYEENYDFLN